jgi:hypothetical protein
MTGDDPDAMIVDPEATEPAVPKKLEDDWCFHTDCRQWGCFGFNGRYGTTWYCGEHRSEGEAQFKR